MSEASAAKSYRAPIVSLVLSVPVQAISYACAAAITDWLPEPAVGLLAHAVLAFMLAGLIGLSPVWRGFNAALWPAAVLAMTYGLPNDALFVVVVLGLLLYLPTFWTKVPYYPTSEKTYEEILKILPKDRAFKFIDLGAGISSLLSYLSTRLPLGSFYGYEISPLAWLISKARFIFPGQGKAAIKYQNFWAINLADFDVVYAFLAPPPMARLWEKAKKEMKPGSIFITNSFEVPAPANQIIEIGDSRRARLFIHRM